MTAGILSGCILCVFCLKGYMKRLQKPKPAAQGGAAPGEKKRSFGDVMFTAMFIGLVSTYIGSYLGTWTSTGDFLPLAVAFVAGLAMAVFEYFARVKKVTWLDNFSMACSMLVGMGAAVLLGAYERGRLLYGKPCDGTGKAGLL